MINRLQRLFNIPSSVWFKNLVWLPICSVPLDWCSNQGLVCKQQDRDHFKKEGCGVFQSDSVWCDWDVKAKHRLLWQRCHFGMNSKDKLETFCWTWEQSIRTENRKQLKGNNIFFFCLGQMMDYICESNQSIVLVNIALRLENSFLTK